MSAPKRVEKVDTLQVEICLRHLSLDIKGLRSRERERAQPLQGADFPAHVRKIRNLKSEGTPL